MAEVFVVDRAALFGGRWPQGYLQLAADEAAELLQRAYAAGRFEDRDTAERTPAWKQWIPYCVLRCTGSPKPGDQNPVPLGIFRVRRSKGQAEARLHGLWSIGLGGHVDPDDRPAPTATAAPQGPAFFAAALQRELAEELHLRHDAPGRPRCVGMLNDETSAVGQVHAGLVYVWDLPVDLRGARESVQVREISKMDGGFGSLVEFRELWQDRLQFESWSQYLIEAGVAGPMGTSSRHQATDASPRRAAEGLSDTQ